MATCIKKVIMETDTPICDSAVIDANVEIISTGQFVPLADAQRLERERNLLLRCMKDLSVWRAQTTEDVPLVTRWGNREDIQDYVDNKNASNLARNAPRWIVAPDNACAKLVDQLEKL